MASVTTEKAPTRQLLERFDDLHVQRFGVRAVIQQGKDAKLIAALWKSHGDALVRDLMADFFGTDDDFVRANGYTVGMFVSQAGKLIARRFAAQRRTPTRGTETIDAFERAAARLEDVHAGRTETTQGRAPVARLGQAGRRDR